VNRAVRLGAVGYLNARPLTWALDHNPHWQVRYDLPSVCAEVLARGDVDLALVSSVEYLRSGEYRLVPGVGIGSRGPVASIGLFARKPLIEVETIAVDTSSLTSVALLKILSERWFKIRPAYVPHRPDLAAMTRACDAALLIGDPALEADHAALDLTKVDLGEEWTAMTSLPFIYAAWTGRGGAVGSGDVEALQVAQDEGVRSFDGIAMEYGRGDAAATARAASYLRDNMKYGLGADEAAGLQLFLDYAADLGLAPGRRRLEFF
jgi:chorismate dehydratase